MIIFRPPLTVVRGVSWYTGIRAARPAVTEPDGPRRAWLGGIGGGARCCRGRRHSRRVVRRPLCTATVGPSLRVQPVRSTVALREVVVTEAATVAGPSGLSSRNLGEPARRGSRGEASWWLIHCTGRGGMISRGLVHRAGCPVARDRGDRAQ